MRLADVIGRWLGKVEIVLSGADEDLRAGQEALAAGEPMQARAAARRVLQRAPDSPIGLALLADACEAAHLDAELALTLEELARRVPSQAEVWVRLARARQATGAPPEDVRDAFVRGLAVAEGGSDARRDALLALADLDLAARDGARAELWLERAADDKAPDVVARRAEARLLRGDAVGARALLDRVEAPATDGRVALARGQALAMLGDPGAFGPLVRAMVLDTAGASEALSSALAYVPSDAQARTRVRSVVDAKGEQELARWRAAFARAEGARDAARRALRDAVEAGDTAAARPLLDAALDDRDADALAVALRAIAPASTRALPPADARHPGGAFAAPATRAPAPSLPDAHALDDGDPVVADARLLATGSLEDVARVRHPRVAPFADAILAEAARAWLPPGATADWPAVLARLDGHARALADLESVAAVAELSAERARPVRLAIVGEFNAGKSTFINALIGADVAPTGVLPTTATLHHLRWAPDRIARIFFVAGHEPPERIVPLADLRATLKAIADGGAGDELPVRRVELLMPMDFLVRVEILDTPGFNAPDARHSAVARGAFEEADAAIWLLDATQAMKQSERAVLEEAKRARLPVQMLVNKADRLAPADLATVMAAVDEALAATGIPSWAPPLALSARKALAGKLGDATALEESGWAAAQALLDERIVARSGEIKERALRRRAARIVARLGAQASAEAARQQVDDEARAAQARTVGQAAAKLERDADVVAEHLAESLAPHAETLVRDLELVHVGRDRASADADRTLASYRVDRALATLAVPLARALASLAPEASLSPAQLGPSTRALVRAAAAAAPGDPHALLAPLSRAAVATLIEQLFALSVAPARPTRAPGMLRELDALAKALD
jgi:GTP-binding protein EngB required for normal cell division